MLSRQEAKQAVERYKKLFEPFLNKTVTIAFDKHQSTTELLDVLQGKVTNFKLLDKRQHGEKQYNPQIMHIKTSDEVTEEDGLYFVLEDIDIVAITKGLRINTGADIIEIRLT